MHPQDRRAFMRASVRLSARGVGARVARPVAPALCSWCAYEVDWTGNVIEPAPPATVVVMTERGERQLCAAHAARGTWERRARRVSRVA